MRLLDHSFASPAENLALDEALLDDTEASGSGEEVLRFWESPVHFAVLGLSQALEDHVFREACTADRVPVLRRCSAGGCVLQGPGCLNYSLILCADRPGCGTIHSSYLTILGEVSRALRAIGCACTPAGISDLAIDSLKVSGSAQRRRKNLFLHHGTLLYAMDLALCSRYLREPGDRPEYRAGREHSAFIRNLPADAGAIRRALTYAFAVSASLPLTGALLGRVDALTKAKYTDPGWNARK